MAVWQATVAHISCGQPKKIASTKTFGLILRTLLALENGTTWYFDVLRFGAHRRFAREIAVQPKIGHLSSGHHFGRCNLKGLAGDAFNVILVAVRSNLRKLLRTIAPALIEWLTQRLAVALGIKNATASGPQQRESRDAEKASLAEKKQVFQGRVITDRVRETWHAQPISIEGANGIHSFEFIGKAALPTVGR